jgi:NAD(P)H-flavin reductase
MMIAVVKVLQKRNFAEERIWLSMERNMQCGDGKCGHCQHGGHFVCKDGPVFAYPEVKDLLGTKGF